jgi:predicted component of type VI protein secretion system
MREEFTQRPQRKVFGFFRDFLSARFVFFFLRTLRKIRSVRRVKGHAKDAKGTEYIEKFEK